MWVAKLKGYDAGNIYASRAFKYKVSMHYYPVNHYLKKNTYYFIAVGIVQGNENSVKDFFEDLNKEKKVSKHERYVVKLEVKGNFFVCITAQTQSEELKKFVHLFYNPKFIHIKPAVIDLDGYEEWSIAALERKDIEQLVKISKKKYNGRLLMLKETKLSNIGILSVLPEITDKQKKAFLSAVENDYYEYPRKIELEKLAAINKISLSTYQAHLRKAERKLLPFIAQKYF